MKTKICAIFLVCIFVLGETAFLLCFGGAGFRVAAADEIPPPPAVFPVIHINVPRSPFVERNTWQNGTITYGDTATGEMMFPTSVRVRGRGNATWSMGPDKRPLRFRLDEPRTMLGSAHEATDWILLANRFDRSLLRNYSALYFANSLGTMDFVPFFQNVHLHVNGTYMGVYLLTDERDVIPGRLEIEHHEDPARSGFFFELCNRAPIGGTENETYIIANHLPYNVRFPSRRNFSPQHAVYLREYIEATSHAIRFGTFDEILEKIDLTTFVDFYIVQELFKNRDAYKYSLFMHITGEGDERRMFMGPVWDFDISAGNSLYKWTGTQPEGLYVAIFHYWYRNLMARPEFFNAVSTRWQEIRHEEVAQTIDRIRVAARRYRYEFERDFERHPRAVPFLRPEFIESNNFLWHTEYLANWLETRASWLDAYFAGQLPDYCHMWELVLYYTHESHVALQINGETQTLQVPIIRLPYATKIALSEAQRIFELETKFQDETLILRQEGITITHTPGKNTFTVNNQTIESAVPSITIQNHIFIPLRVLAEALGYEVGWLNDEQTVILRMYWNGSFSYTNVN